MAPSTVRSSPLQEFPETGVIGSLVFLVGFKGGAVKGVHGIHAHAALEAGSGRLPENPLHLHLMDQVLRALMDGRETVDPLSSQMGAGGQKFPGLLFAGKPVGHGHRIQGGPDHGMVHGVLHPLPQQINLQV
jgi:hypothetical protein